MQGNMITKYHYDSMQERTNRQLLDSSNCFSNASIFFSMWS